MWLVVKPGRRPATLTRTAAMATAAAAVFALGAASTGASVEQMTFNLVGYHANPVAHPWAQRGRVALQLLGDPQVVVLLVSGLVGMALLLWRRRPGGDRLAAGLVALTLTLGYGLARPTYPQYFAFSAPFWVWAGTALWQRAAARRLLVTPLVLGWVVLGPILHRRAVFRSPFPHQTYFSRSEVDAVRQLLARLPPGSEVAAPWPGYVAGTEYRPVEGLESAHGLWAARRLGADERRRFHLLTAEGLRAHVESGGSAAVVLNREDLVYRLVDLERLKERYEAPIQVGSTLVFVRR
jgi:hypothetical protein